MGSISIVAVALNDQRALRDFIDLPKRLYRDDPLWIAPLDLEQRELLSPAKNPFFEHGRAAFWLACRDGRVVGRISAQVDELYEKIHGDRVGYFGLLEAEDDAEVFQRLLEQAEVWLRQQSCLAVRGPFSLSINASCGLLVDGFNTPPYMMMNHAPAYYAKQLERCSYGKSKDLLAYHITMTGGPTSIARQIRRRYEKRVDLRTLDPRQREQGYELMREIFNDAWSANWGFVPFTKMEFQEMGKHLTLLMDPRQAQLAYVDGEAVGMMATLPNINEAITGLNGKLFPLGWARLLWRLKVRGVSGVRVALMGVRRHLHDTPVAGGVAFMMLARAWELSVDKGHDQAELSWILEDNTAIKGVIERIGGTVYKRYRIYEKSLIL